MRFLGLCLLIASLTLVAEHVVRYELRKQELNQNSGVQLAQDVARAVGQQVAIEPSASAGYYSFQPPKTHFEYGVCAGGALGILLLLFGGRKK